MNNFKFLTLAGITLSALTSFVSATAAPLQAEPAVAESRLDKKSAVYTISEHLRFNEGSVVGRNAILFSNFGGDNLDPLNKNGKGYIVALDKNGSRVMIQPDGNLNAPKGMAIKDEYLFIADVSAIWIYNMKHLDETRPVKIKFAEEDSFVNDIIIKGDLLLASVTNTGRLYTVDVSEPEKLGGAVPILVASIPGANGLIEHDGKLYIASYNPTGTPDASNVIYAIDITQPNAEMVNLLGSRKGQYDGVALNEDGSCLYFSNWKNAEGKAEVGFIDLKNGNAVTILDLGVELQGPADILIYDKYLYIPDLVASKIYIMAL